MSDAPDTDDYEAWKADEIDALAHPEMDELDALADAIDAAMSPWLYGEGT